MIFKKIHVLSTKFIEQPLIERAAENHIFIDTIPFIHISPVMNDGLKNEITALADKKIAVIFTSSNAVSIAASYLKGFQLPWSVYCLSGATLETVKKLFPGCDILNTGGNARELAAKIVADKPTRDVVFFCGEPHRADIPAALTQNQIPIKEIVVYKNRLTPEKVFRNYDGVIFFSPGSVRSYLTLNEIMGETTLFAIGETTASELKKFENPLITSEIPDRYRMIEKVIQHFSNSPLTGQLPNK